MAIGKRDGTRSKLIPDVSFSLYDQFAGLDEDDTDEPPFSPAIAIEVWSRGDSEEYLAKKFERFLLTGSQLILDVRPKERTVTAYTTDSFEVDDLFGVIDVLPEQLRKGE